MWHTFGCGIRLFLTLSRVRFLPKIVQGSDPTLMDHILSEWKSIFKRIKSIYDGQNLLWRWVEATTQCKGAGTCRDEEWGAGLFRCYQKTRYRPLCSGWIQSAQPRQKSAPEQWHDTEWIDRGENQNAQKKGQVGTMQSFESTLANITKFRGQGISVENVTVEWLEGFNKYMAQSRAATTIAINMRNIRTLPFRDWKIRDQDSRGS